MKVGGRGSEKFSEQNLWTTPALVLRGINHGTHYLPIRVNGCLLLFYFICMVYLRPVTQIVKLERPFSTSCKMVAYGELYNHNGHFPTRPINITGN